MRVCTHARYTGGNGEPTKDADPRPVVPSCDPAPRTLHASLPRTLTQKTPAPSAPPSTEGPTLTRWQWEHCQTPAMPGEHAAGW